MIRATNMIIRLKKENKKNDTDLHDSIVCGMTVQTFIIIEINYIKRYL